ncbi:hypothetical protein MUP59_10220, partial [Candidatus Bathyarchaeota archaeon]|nr:hypothetical protein [Candidatus Bathyarchaeota archaeon]
ENVEETNRSIAETGAITREASEEDPVSEVPVEESPPATEETVAPTDPTERTLELDEEAVLAIAAAVIGNPQFISALEDMRTSVASAVSGFETLTREMNEMRAANIKIARDLSERLELVERSANDVVNEAIADLPRNTVARVMYRPSKPQNASEDEQEESLEDVAKRTLALFPHP